MVLRMLHHVTYGSAVTVGLTPSDDPGVAVGQAVAGDSAPSRHAVGVQDAPAPRHAVARAAIGWGVTVPSPGDAPGNRVASAARDGVVRAPAPCGRPVTVRDAPRSCVARVQTPGGGVTSVVTSPGPVTRVMTVTSARS